MAPTGVEVLGRGGPRKEERKQQGDPVDTHGQSLVREPRLGFEYRLGSMIA